MSTSVHLLYGIDHHHPHPHIPMKKQLEVPMRMVHYSMIDPHAHILVTKNPDFSMVKFPPSWWFHSLVNSFHTSNTTSKQHVWNAHPTSLLATASYRYLIIIIMIIYCYYWFVYIMYVCVWVCVCKWVIAWHDHVRFAWGTFQHIFPIDSPSSSFTIGPHKTKCVSSTPNKNNHDGHMVLVPQLKVSN